MHNNGAKMLESIGIVAIGRNEGERFCECLASLPLDLAAVYVDSGSTDNSVANAQAAGIHVVHLSSKVGFTAARARNLGWHTLLVRHPGIQFVQFIDGDCSLDPHWLEEAIAAMEANDGLAVVFGRRRERFPEKSYYNAQCDREWDIPLGEVRACGGDAFMRVEALMQVHGYNDHLIAGEEPDLCLRMRSRGWKIRRISQEMTMHDAAIFNFGTWWKRAKRAGHAYTEHVFIHQSMADPDWTRALASMTIWALILPGSAIFGILLGLFANLKWLLLPLAVALIFLFQFSRLWVRSRAQGLSNKSARKEALLSLIAKFAHCAGAAAFVTNIVRGRRSALMEYK